MRHSHASALLSCIALLLSACAPDEPPPPVEDCECGERICGRICGTKSCGVCPDDGVCAADGLSCRPALAIGAPCANDLACGTGRICLGVAEQAPGGYCSRRCGEGDACPGDAICRPGAQGENTCFAACTPGGAPACRESEGYRCDAAGFCPACVPSCTGRSCGDDGCGGSCGTCEASGTACEAGACASVYSDAGRMPAPAWELTTVRDHLERTILIGGREVVRYVGNITESRGVDRVLQYQGGAAPFLTLAKLPEPLARPHAAVAGTTLFVAGGTLDPDVQGQPDAIAQNFYELEGNRWKLLGVGLPEASTGGGAVGLGGKLYVFAGAAAGGLSKRVDAYDPATKLWSVAGLRPHASTLFALASDGSRAYVIGGWDGQRALASVTVFDPASGFTPAPDLPVPVVGAQAVVADGRIFVFGGHEGPGTGDPRPLVQTIDLATRRTLVLGTTWNGLVGQAPARTREGAVLLFGATEQVNGVLVPHDEIVRFRVPAP